MKLVLGAPIDLSFLNSSVRKMCSSFPFSQELLETGISSSPICLVLRALNN